MVGRVKPGGGEGALTRFSSLHELTNAAGSDLGCTGWHQVTQHDVQRFAEATSAFEWIHVDEERARQEGPFGTTVAHGYLTLSLATRFITELLDLAQAGLVGVNYGLDRVRFPDAVPVGSRVRARGILRTVTPAGPGVRTLTALTYETDGAGKPPCVAEVLSLILPAHPTG